MTFINTVTLKNDTNKVIRRVRASKEPVIVTQHGHPAVVIIPVKEDDLVFKHEKAYLKAVQQGLHDIKAGRTVSLKSFVQKHLR
ncbi:MAG: type II toxin-antitoxin system Phd/YefM family antitoxin [Elusimicrobia bacterium]|nr:type II toxin-antitoxin system Phd/YefM family antitoxin [Elusimicrobiota bacterium]